MNTEYFSSINDVSVRLDVPAHTLRYWEKQFPAAIKPTTGAGGRRYYRPETVATLHAIKDLLYNRGMTIAGVKKMLRDGTLPESAECRVQSADIRMSKISPTASKSEVDDAIELLKQAHALLS